MSIHPYYLQLRSLLIVCVACSGVLFAVRGTLRLANRGAGSRRWLDRLSYAIDSLLLAAAIALMFVIGQYPLTSNWLTAKMLLLMVYITLGSRALRRGKTQEGRTAAFVGALIAFGCIVGIAVTHRAAGWLTLIH